MKTVNGSNKLERQITKAQKYMGITLEKDTNKYLKITNIEDKENTYIFIGSFDILETQYGTKVKFQPENAEKAMWIDEYRTINDDNFYCSFVIFKKNEYNKAIVEKLEAGADDVFNLQKVFDMEEHTIIEVTRK